MAASFDLFYAAARNRYGTALPDDYIAAEFERLSGAKPVLTDEQFREHRYADPGVGTDVKRAIGTEVGKTRLGLGSVPYAVGEVANLWAKGPDWLAQGLGKLGIGDGQSDLGQQLRGLGQMSTAWGAGLREGGKEQLRRNLPAASLTGNPVDNPELLARPDYWTASTAGGIANMVPSLAGLLAGGPTGLGVMAALQETLPEYGEMRENPNMGAGERAARSAAMGVGSFLLNRLAPGIAKKAGVLGTAGTELGTEHAEELMQYGLGQQAPTAQGLGQAARAATSLLPMMAVPSLALGGLTAGSNRVQEDERARVRKQLEALQKAAPATPEAQPTPAAPIAEATATPPTDALSAAAVPGEVTEASAVPVAETNVTPSESPRDDHANKYGEVDQALEPLTARWGKSAPGLDLYDDDTQRPAENLKTLGEGVLGWTDLATGRVGLVRSAIVEEARERGVPVADVTQRVLAHESVGHYGLNRLMGERWQSLLTGIRRLAQIDRTVGTALAEVMAVPKYAQAAPDVQAAEVLAKIAESNPNHSLVQQVVAWVREGLRKAGFTVAWSYNDIVGLLHRAARQNESGAERATVPPDLFASRSAMKSVGANIARGRKAMARVLIEKADAHRAMFRTGMGWVDFVWGRDETPTGRAGTRLPGKRQQGATGIAHLLIERMGKDGLTAPAARRVAEKMVDTIARGQEVSRDVEGLSETVRLQYDRHQALLTRRKGSNAWLITGWEETPDVPAATSAAGGPTYRRTTHGHAPVGAGANGTVDPERPAGKPEPLAARPQPMGPMGGTTTGTQAPPAPTPAPQTLAAGGGEYTTAPFLGMPPEMQQALLGVMQLPETDARIAGERVDETVSWEQTGREAQALLGSEFGALFNDLANRTPRTVANAARLEAFARIVNAGGRSVVEAAQQYNRSGSAEDLKRLVAAKEQLGLVLAPFMGYRTEAGRSLQILQKMQADFRDATAIFEALGSGTEQAMREFAQRIAKAPTVEAALALTRAVYRPTLWDQFYEYWINGLLSGPWTHAVNLTSNALFNALELGTELVAGMVSPNVSGRAALARISGQVAGLQLGLANAGKAFTTEEPQLNPTTQVESEKRRAIPGKMGRLVRLPGRALMAEDEFAKAIAFTGELHRLAMERAIAAHPRTPHAVFAQQLAALANDRPAQAQARNVADRLTFQTPLGPLGNIGVHWLNRSKVGRILVPFVRTPTNILKRALEYTPAGMTMQQVRDDVLGRNTKRDRDLALARMAVGSSVMLGVASLVAQGLATGAGPDDPAERALWQRTGRKPYSLRVGDQWVRYNRFEPVGMLIGVAADMAEIGAALPAKDAETIATMLMTSVANNLGDKTFLRGITDFAQAYTDPGRYMGQWAQGLAGTSIPNVAAQAARASDPYVREARGIVDALKARVPGLRQELPRKLDVAGQPIEASAVEPLAATRARSDPLAETMLRLGAFRGAPSRTLQLGGARYEMSGAEYEAYQSALQQARWAALTPMVNSPQFQALAREKPLAAKDYLEDQWDKIGRAARDQHLVTHPEMVRKAFAARRTPAPSQYGAGP